MRFRPGKTRPAAAALACLCGLAVTWTAPARAFHDGGAASCGACHVMHPGGDGQVAAQGSRPLLRAPTATDVCLLCHGGQDGVFGDNPLNPPRERGAGNFVFLLEDNLNDGPDGAASTIAGEAAGHSVVSLDRGVGPDTRHIHAPGGTFPADQLGCTSCHDPHGNAGFRLLNGAGPVQAGLYDFSYGAPAARGLDITDATAREADDRHTAYARGMSDWCANCHGFYHEEGSTSGFQHPADAVMGPEHNRSYSMFNGVSDPAGSFPHLAYLAAVPFESGKATVTSTEGSPSGSRVMCLSCHRAHASSAPHAGRWDFNVDRLDGDGQVSGSWPIPNPYPHDHAQGPLCIKCHSQDGDG